MKYLAFYISTYYNTDSVEGKIYIYVIFVLIFFYHKGLFNEAYFTISIFGGIAHLVEHLPCTQDVEGSNPSASTN